MINLANTKPPQTIEIDGHIYPINYDFRVWIEVSVLLQDIDLENIGSDDNINTISAVTTLVFGGIIDVYYGDVLLAILEFFKGYPKVGNGYSSIEEDDGTKLYSFKHDLNYIILAIRNQSNIDLSYRRTEPFHWWEFMLEFQTLTDEHYISKIMSYRGYKGNDKDHIKLRDIYALPIELTRSEQLLIDKFEDAFYDC